MVILRSSWALRVRAPSAVVVSMILAMEGGTSAMVSGVKVSRESGWHTRSQAPLVNPAVDLGALLLELLNPGLHVGELALELLNLLGVGAHGLVEGLGEQIWHGLGLHAGAQRRGGLSHGHGVDAVGKAARVLRFLGLLGARVHVLSWRRDLRLLRLLLLLLGVGGFRSDLLVVVVGLGSLWAVVLDVAVSPGAALEEDHWGEGVEERARRWNAI